MSSRERIFMPVSRPAEARGTPKLYARLTPLSAPPPRRRAGVALALPARALIPPASSALFSRAARSPIPTSTSQLHPNDMCVRRHQDIRACKQPLRSDAHHVGGRPARHSLHEVGHAFSNLQRPMKGTVCVSIRSAAADKCSRQRNVIDATSCVHGQGRLCDRPMELTSGICIAGV